MGIALIALLVPLSLTTANAAPANGAFKVKAQNAENPAIESIVGMTAKDYDTAPIAPIDPVTPTPTTPPTTTPPTTTPPVTPTPTTPPQSGTFVFTVDNSLCTNSRIYFSGITGTTTIRFNDGTKTALAEGWTSIAKTGQWTVDGSFAQVGLGTMEGAPDTGCITSVDKWGTTGTTKASFSGNQGLRSVVAPPATVTDMSWMFAYIANLNIDLSGWNMSNVTNADFMFESAKNFNGDLSSWNVGNLQSADYMFANATAFTGIGLSGWNTSKLQSAEGMFQYGRDFNADISNWNTSNLANMASMFMQAKTFNRNLNSWDTSKVRHLFATFYGASSFNGNIQSWNVKAVLSMGSMLHEASSFTGNLNSWKACAIPKAKQFDASGEPIASKYDKFGIPAARQPQWGICA